MAKKNPRTQVRVYNPRHEKYFGLRGAIFLQQVHYWLKRSKHQINGRKWIYNKYDNWCGDDNFPSWNVRTVKRIVKKLRGMGILTTDCRLNRMKRDWTNWYTINYEHPILKEYPLINRVTKCHPKPKKQSDKMSPTRVTKCHPKSELGGQNVTLQGDKMSLPYHKTTTVEKQDHKTSSSKGDDDFSSDTPTTKLNFPNGSKKKKNQKIDDQIKSDDQVEEESLNSDAKISHERWLDQKSEHFRSEIKLWVVKEIQYFSGKIQSRRRFRLWLIKQVREETEKGQEFYDQYTSERGLKQLVEGMYGKMQDKKVCKMIM